MRIAVLACVLLAACATNRTASTERRRNAAEAKQLIEANKERTAHIRMLTDAEVHEALPKWPRQRPIPNLLRVSAYMPETMQAEMGMWRALSKEGTLDRRFLSEIFYVVSSANDCFY